MRNLVFGEERFFAEDPVKLDYLKKIENIELELKELNKNQKEIIILLDQIKEMANECVPLKWTQHPGNP